MTGQLTVRLSGAPPCLFFNLNTSEFECRTVEMEASLQTPLQSFSPEDQLESQVVFLHGLNTFGDDVLHFGPMKFGKMDRPLKTEFSRFGIKLRSVPGIGQGSPEEQAKLVLCWLRNQLAEKQLSTDLPLVLIGNSLGGLVARVVAHQIRNSELSNWNLPLLITWGTPHRGVLAAGLADRWFKRQPKLFEGLNWIARIFKYEVTRRTRTFRYYTPEALDNFNQKYPELKDRTKEVSLLCRVNARKTPICLWPLYPLIHDLSYLRLLHEVSFSNSKYSPSDGLIPVGSQIWGEVTGDFQLDHFSQIGFFQFLPRRADREFAKLEFARLVSCILNLCILHLCKPNRLG